MRSSTMSLEDIFLQLTTDDVETEGPGTKGEEHSSTEPPAGPVDPGASAPDRSEEVE